MKVIIVLLFTSLTIASSSFLIGPSHAQQSTTLPPPSNVTATATDCGGAGTRGTAPTCTITVRWDAIQWPTPVTYQAYYIWEGTPPIGTGIRVGRNDLCGPVVNELSCQGRAPEFIARRVQVSATAQNPQNPTGPPLESGSVVTPVQQPGAEIRDRADCGCGDRSIWSRIFFFNPAVVMQKAICEAVCAVSHALGGLVEWMVLRLIDVAGISYQPQWQYALHCPFQPLALRE
jgi:hypothetical protein